MNWQALADAINFYKAFGFEYKDVPWAVSQEVMNMTKPVNKLKDRTFILEDQKELIASAEQGFIHLLLNNELPPGRYVTCSPCFRGEPVYDAIHQPYFMKVELYSSITTEVELNRILSTAEKWYALCGLNTTRVQINDDQIDLVSKDIELGSYGVRVLENTKFLYGTGNAEPRTSYVKSL